MFNIAGKIFCPDRSSLKEWFFCNLKDGAFEEPIMFLKCDQKKCTLKLEESNY